MTIDDQIGMMDRDELLRVRELVNARFGYLSLSAKADFQVGDTVEFPGRRKQTMRGTVQKILQKNIKVNCGSGGTWRVTPTLLTKVEG